MEGGTIKENTAHALEEKVVTGTVLVLFQPRKKKKKKANLPDERDKAPPGKPHPLVTTKKKEIRDWSRGGGKLGVIRPGM